MKLKICGIRRTEDVQYLNAYKPDFAGFICSQPFWRYVKPEQVAQLTQQLDEGILRVGVFVDPTIEEIARYAQLLHVIQLHGNEPPALIAEIRKRWDVEIWKAARVRTAEDIRRVDALLVDKLVLDSFSPVSHGGTGTVADWALIAENRPEKPFLLAGGISAENAAEAAQLHPWGLDASSSVETDKCKDADKIRTLVARVRALS